jgi:hypothetical protein
VLRINNALYTAKTASPAEPDGGGDVVLTIRQRLSATLTNLHHPVLEENSMFTFVAALALLPLSLAGPVALKPRAPIHRAVDVGGRNANNSSYIVAFKPKTVRPNNRESWLNRVLSAQSVTLDQDTTQSLKLKWEENTFNGIAGTFSDEALTALREQPEVAWIQEGPPLPSVDSYNRYLTNECHSS